MWRIRARQVVLATGAHERPVVVRRQRPARHHARRAARAPTSPVRRAGRRAAPSSSPPTTAPTPRRSTSPTRACEVAAVVDARPTRPALGRAWPARGIARADRLAWSPARRATTRSPRASAPAARRRPRQRRIDCDLLLVCGGWNPAVHLFSQARGKLRYDEALGAFVPGEPLAGASVVGAASGAFDLAGVPGRADAQPAARALAELGFTVPRIALPAVADRSRGRRRRSGWSPADAGRSRARHFVDLQRDATVADLRRAVGAGMRSVEHVKRYTTIGTAHDQGKTSGVDRLRHRRRARSACRSPSSASRLPAALHAGGVRGPRRPRPRRPARPDPGHRRCTTGTSPHGARVRGRRPVEAAVVLPAARGGHGRRRAARVPRPRASGVGVMDASTLGKIDVQGPDAGEFLDRLYTNLMSTLKVGTIRYGVMCRRRRHGLRRRHGDPPRRRPLPA